MRRRLLPVVAVLLFAGGVALAVLGARAIDLERGEAGRRFSDAARQELSAVRKRLVEGRAALPPPDEVWVVARPDPESALAAAPEDARLRLEEAEFRERRGDEKAALEILARLADSDVGKDMDAYRAVLVAAARGGALARRLGDLGAARRLLLIAADANRGWRAPEGPRLVLIARRHLNAMAVRGEVDGAPGMISLWRLPGGVEPEISASLDDGDVYQSLADELEALPATPRVIALLDAISGAVEWAARGHAALAATDDRRFAVVRGALVTREPGEASDVVRVVAFSPATLAARWSAERVSNAAVHVSASPADVPDDAESVPAPAPFEGLTLYAVPRVPLSPGSGAPWVLAAGILAYAVGGGVSLVATARARRAARMQADFVAAVSHEMKTPIAAVQAMAEMLADERVPDPARARAYAERMRAEMVRLGATVRNVLDAARIERGEGARVAPRPMDPATVVEDLTAVVRPVLEARGYRFLVAAAPAPLPVATDPDALASVLTNLLDNAAKFAAAGREVAVEAGPTETGYRIAVLDRGPGVPEGDREHVFERFWRGRGAKEGAVPGVGLGLHVARELVKAHGGTIRVEEREGGGASFVVEWPREGAA